MVGRPIFALPFFDPCLCPLEVLIGKQKRRPLLTERAALFVSGRRLSDCRIYLMFLHSLGAVVKP